MNTLSSEAELAPLAWPREAALTSNWGTFFLALSTIGRRALTHPRPYPGHLLRTIPEAHCYLSAFRSNSALGTGDFHELPSLPHMSFGLFICSSAAVLYVEHLYTMWLHAFPKSSLGHGRLFSPWLGYYANKALWGTLILALACYSHSPVSRAQTRAGRLFTWLKEKFQWGLVVQTLNRNGRIYSIDFNRKEKKPSQYRCYLWKLKSAILITLRNSYYMYI